jgi:hypothetical protein
MGMTDSPLRRRCGTEQGTSAHVLCECEALATLIHTCLGPFLLDPADVRGRDLQVIWNFIKGTVFPWLGFQPKGQGLSKAFVHRDLKGSNPPSSLFYMNVCTVEHFSGLTGTSHPHMQMIRIIGFFFESRLHRQFEARLLLFALCTWV